MRRWAASLLTAVAIAASQPAAACSCVPYPSQAEIDAAGERAYAAADLIVDATAGGWPAAYRRICFAAGGKPRPADYGRRIAMSRPLTIHRVLKGTAPRSPLLFAHPAEVSQDGRGIITNSCEVEAPLNGRSILVLRKVPDGRYQPLSVCEMMALHRSKRGQALFNRGR